MQCAVVGNAAKSNSSWKRQTRAIVTPSGKVAFIPAEMLSPLGIDQLCYAKLDGAWRIIGYAGEGGPQ